LLLRADVGLTASSVQKPRHNSVCRDAASLLAALVLCALVLFCGTLAGSPSLHEHVHHDAEHAEHECVISLFANGSIHFEPAAPVHAAPIVSAALPEPPALTVLLPALTLLFPQERGPPVLPS